MFSMLVVFRHNTRTFWLYLFYRLPKQHFYFYVYVLGKMANLLNSTSNMLTQIYDFYSWTCSLSGKFELFILGPSLYMFYKSCKN